MRPDFNRVISELDLLGILAEFDPVVIGTPPLGIATENSDIDIACSADDLERFADLAEQEFASLKGFSKRFLEIHDEAAVVVSFDSSGWEIELFCQRLDIEDQWGVRHFRIEQRLLRLEPRLRLEVHRLKQRGLKTEPAFAKALNLDGDPYQAILDLENETEVSLRKLLEGISVA